MEKVTGPDPDPRQEQPLDDVRLLQTTVGRLRRDLDGLQKALRHRAVIEQAKGIVMAEDQVDAEVAFDRLRRAARDGNRRLLDVAADQISRFGAGEVDVSDLPDVVGSPDPAQAVPPTPGPRPPAPGPDGRPAPHDRDLAVLTAAAAGCETVQELARVLADYCRWPARADRVAVMSVSADSSLDLAAHAGLATATATRWQHVPIDVPSPASACARTGVPVFEDDPDAALGRWPVFIGRRDVIGTFCDVPVIAGGTVVGVVGLGWPEGTRLTGADRRMLRASVRAVTPYLLRLLPAGGVHELVAPIAPGQQQQLAVGVVLDAVGVEAVVLLPVADEPPEEHGPAAGCPAGQGPPPAGPPTDLVVVWGNRPVRDAVREAGPAAGHVLGRRVSVAAPQLIGTRLWAACLDTVERGGPRRVPTAAWFWGSGSTEREVTVGPVWNGVLLTRAPVHPPR